MIGRLLQSRIRPMLFDEVSLYHFFETAAGDKFCKTEDHLAVPVLGPDQNGKEVTFNRTRIIKYIGDDRTKLFLQNEAVPAVAAVAGMTICNWDEMDSGSWFTDGKFVYRKFDTTVNKYDVEGVPVADSEEYEGPKEHLKFLGHNVLHAWNLVEEGCRVSK